MSWDPNNKKFLEFCVIALNESGNLKFKKSCAETFLLNEQ